MIKDGGGLLVWLVGAAFAMGGTASQEASSLSLMLLGLPDESGDPALYFSADSGARTVAGKYSFQETAEY